MTKTEKHALGTLLLGYGLAKLREVLMCLDAMIGPGSEFEGPGLGYVNPKYHFWQMLALLGYTMIALSAGFLGITLLFFDYE